MIMSISGAREVTSSNICWAVSMGTTLTNGHGSNEVFPVTRVTSAPRSEHSRARA